MAQLRETLTDGTEYAIQVPENWNGILVNDLDGAGHLGGPGEQATFFLDHGYAYSGTNRRPDRDTHFDPRAERDAQAQVSDIFTARFGEPRYAIQFGCSGGGGVALGVAEAYPDRFDGAISFNGVEGLVVSNNRLDLLFALKSLLAPDGDLPVAGMRAEDSREAGKAWGAVLETALQDPAGRAKIALAGTLAQWPTWGGVAPPYLPAPDPDDAAAVQEAFLRSIRDGAGYAAATRHLYDSPAGVLSWNTGIDYRQFYAEADPAQQRIVQALYARAGLPADQAVRADLDAINACPRISPAPGAVEHWGQRALTGNLRVPVLQINTVGDASRSAAMMSAYAQGVRAHGKTDLYRQALIDAAGHCTHHIPEIAAALTTMVRRLDTGTWDDTTPDALNKTGHAAGVGEPRFIPTHGLPAENNRAYLPDTDQVEDPKARMLGIVEEPSPR